MTESDFDNENQRLEDFADTNWMGKEEALRFKQEIAAIGKCKQILSRASDEKSLLEEICRVLCDEGGYQLVWAGYAENDVEKTVRPVAWAGFNSGYIKNARITWADTELGRGPTGSAIRRREIVCVQDMLTDERMSPWRWSALERGCKSSAALPLKDEEARTFGVLNFYAAEPDAFTPYRLHLFEAMAANLASAILALRDR